MGSGGSFSGGKAAGA